MKNERAYLVGKIAKIYENGKLTDVFTITCFHWSNGSKFISPGTIINGKYKRFFMDENDVDKLLQRGRIDYGKHYKITIQ